MRKNNATLPVQREAFDRLRGEQHTTTRKAADVDWERLSKAVKAALQVPDKTRDATTEELQAIFALLKPGENCNGWVNPYAKDDPRSLLKQNQFESFHDQSQFIMDVQSRQTGKDYTLGGVAAEDCIKHALTEWTTAAPSERQSLESLAKQRVWIEAFGDVVDDYQETRDGPQALMRSACIVLPNGSKLRAVPGMPHTVRGLAHKLGVTKPVITRALDSMGKQAIIARRRDEADKRNVIIQRTVKGALYVEKLGDMVIRKAADIGPGDDL
jgi:hypothetical protein